MRRSGAPPPRARSRRDTRVFGRRSARCMSLATIAAPLLLREPATTQLLLPTSASPMSSSSAAATLVFAALPNQAGGAPASAPRSRRSPPRRAARRSCSRSAAGRRAAPATFRCRAASRATRPRCSWSSCRSKYIAQTTSSVSSARQGRGMARSTRVFEGPRRQRVEARVDAGGIALEHGPVGLGQRGQGRAGARREAVQPPLAVDRQQGLAEQRGQLAAPARRSRSIWKKRSCACT